jgi:BolA protein
MNRTTSWILQRSRFTMSTTTTATATHPTPVADAIVQNLHRAFSPLSHLEIRNESHRHNVPPHSETHFQVVVVAERFNDVPSLVQRHRLVNEALAPQLAGPVHALSIVAKTPAQWQAMGEQGQAVPATPKCRGGDGTFATRT